MVLGSAMRKSWEQNQTRQEVPSEKVPTTIIPPCRVDHLFKHENKSGIYSSCTLVFGFYHLHGIRPESCRLLVLRFVLGLSEEDVYLGCTYLVGSWYT